LCGGSASYWSRNRPKRIPPNPGFIGGFSTV
jgi:hypothetical protein